MKKALRLSKRMLFLLPTILVFSLVLNQEVRSQIRSVLNPDSRVILSILNADVLHDKTSAKVIKIKLPDGIRVEIYSRIGGSELKLIASYHIADKRDGYFNFNGRATNLAIDDIDDDGKLEILAPSFDENLTAHLNILKYDEQSKTLSKIIN